MALILLFFQRIFLDSFVWKNDLCIFCNGGAFIIRVGIYDAQFIVACEDEGVGLMKC